MIKIAVNMTLEPDQELIRVGSYRNDRLIEPRREKTVFFFAYAKTKTQISEADQRLCFRYTDSTIPLVSKSEISSL